MRDTHFPGPDSLCEACGYALRGLSCDGACPECGQAIAESSPDLRTGPAWHDGSILRGLAQTLSHLTFHPKRFFRTMRIDGSNDRARLFLALVAGMCGLGWGAMELALQRGGDEDILARSTAAALGVIVLSYIEALGVTFFSRRRDWRVPFNLAERLVCYASIGWVPAAAAMGVIYRLLANGTLDRWMQRLLGVWGPWQAVALWMMAGSVAMLGFEVLVWTGVRQTKHANSCHDPRS